MHFKRLPGLIDVHVHVREPGQEHKETWRTATRAAAAGGITMLLAMPNTQPPLVSEEDFERVDAIANANAYVDYGLYVGANSSNVNMSDELATKAAGLKLLVARARHRFANVRIACRYLNSTFGTLKLDSTDDWLKVSGKHIRFIRQLQLFAAL